MLFRATDYTEKDIFKVDPGAKIELPPVIVVVKCVLCVLLTFFWGFISIIIVVIITVFVFNTIHKVTI